VLRGPRRFLLLAILVAMSAATASAAPTDFAGLVDIGGGRKMYLECRGEGAPTVVLISGKGNGAADWNTVLDPVDPVRNVPFDAVGAGEGRQLASEAAVFPAVSRFTRVCAYDRPGTRIDGADISTPVMQPHRVDQDVDDLHTLLTAGGEPRPYVLVAHSYGGLVALLYARLHSEEVSGLVMVDAASDLIRQEASAEELAGWDASNRVSDPATPEAVELLDGMGRIEAAPHLPHRPTIVLSADKPWQSPAPDAHGHTSGGVITFAEWLAAQHLLAASLHAAHVTETHSGHHIYLYQPELVVDAVRQVVDEVRSSGGQNFHAGLVDIGGSRKMYLECRGTGSPTVVLIAGGFEAGWMWTYALAPDDPVLADPDDGFSSGRGNPRKLDSAVFPSVAKFTRLCLYDRPNTTQGQNITDERNGQVSTPVPQPHLLEDDVVDLHAILIAADEPGPYVLVAHSYGGMIAELFASRYSKDVVGEVLVDVTSVYLREAFTPEEYQELVASVRVAPAEGIETLDLDNAIDVILAASPRPQVPAVVLAAVKGPKGMPHSRKGELLEAQTRLAAQLGARLITDTKAGHHIYVEQPQLVNDAIREVVEAVRAGKTRLTP
jgi:pimeloyl-ACP methyl ester carboxylesterase